MNPKINPQLKIFSVKSLWFIFITNNNKAAFLYCSPKKQSLHIQHKIRSDLKANISVKLSLVLQFI